MKTLTVLVLLAMPAMAMAAVSGTVLNGTTGQPLAGATVEVDRMGVSGFESAGEARTDAQGRFSFSQELQGPQMLRVPFEGVTYFRTVPPGTPSTGLEVVVYAASRLPGAAKVSKHMLFFEPSESGSMAVQETFICTNAGKTAWHDPGQGELRFYLPPSAIGEPQVSATAPGGMPVPAPLVKTSTASVMAIDFAIKPGETRFDLAYTVPYTAGQPYQGQVATSDENTYLIAPQGITLAGGGLTDLGTEPRTQAHLFGLSGTSYRITLTGAVAPPEEPAAAAADDSGNGPPIETVPPRINRNTLPILGLVLAVLAVGFVLLYRKSQALPAPPKEIHERGRR
jgi:5-hydroxyisourate hydrolase-like protein (transthyretin family)